MNYGLNQIARLIFLAMLLAGTVDGKGAFGIDDWPNYRGPGNFGRADESKLPVQWSEDKNVVWKTPIEGKATTVKAGREYEVLAKSQLDEGFMASPAVSGNALFLRTRTHLYRIEE